ncbi:PAQR family membrane homeostasis protein TrhA [Nesterenkonia alkaliphila]|uniref:Hemolysin III family protein n=1 Tax=Nesterenkonia alkaliphila TaxID=1463631 RepID=A0A7K1UJC8_9MICC|nr:hemolysin III family protein [Nesterenkonia alkaliphila]MVT26595.1 hemolysin III family protein [Nesterenkonia alkaliphila]GFZ92083.1 DNA-binding protein [Nesterenkonia alkaliphila]
MDKDVPTGDTAPADRLFDTDVPLKPRMRGWLHAGMVPLALAAGIVVVVLSPTTELRIASAIYALTGLLLFAVSATYHLGRWSPPTARVLKRLDHTNIMLIIAGTYTPLTLALLEDPARTILLTAVWVGALGGVAFRLFWTDAPRWLYTVFYIVLGLAAVWFIGDFFAADIAAAVLVCVGGAAYITGAVFYALKRPNFSPQWFGFHELFHACTLVGFICHYIAIVMGIL